jgi:hypothetical protein
MVERALGVDVAVARPHAPDVSSTPGADVSKRAPGVTPRCVTVEFSAFGFERLLEEAEAQRVSLEEIVVHATMYYLADVDAGRISRRVLRDPYHSPVDDA